MAYVGSQYGIIDHNKITKIFVGADVLAIITQSGGGAMLVRLPSSSRSDKYSPLTSQCALS